MVWGRSYKHRTPTVRLQFGVIRMNTECPRVQLLIRVVHIETEHPSTVSIGSFGDEREHLMSIHDRYEGWVVRRQTPKVGTRTRIGSFDNKRLMLIHDRYEDQVVLGTTWMYGAQLARVMFAWEMRLDDT